MKTKICKQCNIELPINKFEKQNKKLSNGNISYYFRSKCNYCRVKENKDRNNKYDLYRKRYWNMSEEQRLIYIEKKTLQNAKRKNISEKRKEYNKSDKGIFLSYMHESRRRTKLSKGIKFELKYEEFVHMINDICAYCGKKNCRGIDRIDNNKSYALENSVPCCKICNWMKKDLSLQEFKDHITKIYLRK
jgi:hypothetical protein